MYLRKKKCEMKRSEMEVREFLNRFVSKTSIWGIVYLDRDKNLAAMTQLGITAVQRDGIVMGLTVEDYVETLESMIPGASDLWVFGKRYEHTELYIKVSLGFPDSNAVCVSFHIAEYPINYAFK